MSLFGKRSWVFLLIACATLAGCSGGENAKAPDSQDVARIGPDVVTIQELENEMRHNNIQLERRKDPDVVKKLVGDLVTRKLLTRRALSAKLDREPTVLLDLLRSKDIVLAEATSARAVNARVSSLTSADLEKYIQANPQKFANRQVLRMEQLVAPLSDGLQAVIDASKSAKTLDEVAQLLAKMSVPFSRSSSTLSTAELPEEIEGAFRAQGLDSIVFTRAGQNGVFLKVQGRENRPLTGAAAEASARQLIRTDLARSEASLAAFTAKLEATYVGDYAKIMAEK